MAIWVMTRFTVIPAAELATVTHHGSVDGPIREYYTIADTDTPDSSAWRTEIGLPIFSTGERT